MASTLELFDLNVDFTAAWTSEHGPVITARLYHVTLFTLNFFGQRRLDLYGVRHGGRDGCRGGGGGGGRTASARGGTADAELVVRTGRAARDVRQHALTRHQRAVN